MPSCSVIIVSHRTPALTMRAARSALASLDGEVIVVDNASGDETLGQFEALDAPRLVTIANDANVGFGSAANRAARSASGSVLVFLNSDAELSADASEALRSEVERYRGRAIVGPRLVGVDGTVQRSTGLTWSPTTLALRALGIHRLAAMAAHVPLIGRLVRQTNAARGYESAQTATGPTEADVVTGACFAVGREAFLQLGGFDEQFFLYFEDIDLCRRARAAGFAIRYLPEAVVPHIGGASSADDYHFGPAHARSMRQYLAKWYGPGGAVFAVLLLWLRAVGFTVSLRPQAGRAWRSLWAALRPGAGAP